jgi:hypothetical protein
LGLFSHELNFRDLLDPNYFYFQSRVLRSYDFGMTWEPSMDGLYASNLRIAGRGNRFAAFHNTKGIYTSPDNGIYWSANNNRNITKKPFQVKFYGQNEGILALTEDKKGESRMILEINNKGNFIQKSLPTTEGNQSIQILGSHIKKYVFVVKYKKKTSRKSISGQKTVALLGIQLP